MKVESEAAAVVEEEERAGVAGALVARTEAEFVADAVAAAHEFRAGFVGELVGGFDGCSAEAFAGGPAEGVGDVLFIGNRFLDYARNDRRGVARNDGTVISTDRREWRNLIQRQAAAGLRIERFGHAAPDVVEESGFEERQTLRFHGQAVE